MDENLPGWNNPCAKRCTLLLTIITLVYSFYISISLGKYNLFVSAFFIDLVTLTTTNFFNKWDHINT